MALAFRVSHGPSHVAEFAALGSGAAKKSAPSGRNPLKKFERTA